jgi:hypothetical protein
MGWPPNRPNAQHVSNASGKFYAPNQRGLANKSGQFRDIRRNPPRREATPETGHRTARRQCPLCATLLGMAVDATEGGGATALNPADGAIPYAANP